MMMAGPPQEIFTIIVTYQSADHIQACLASLPQAEGVRQLTIAVIDNASSDGTPALLEETMRALPQPRVRSSHVRNPENLGFTRALNQGLVPRPAGAAVLFLNPDTLLPPNSLAALMQKLYADDHTGVVAPQLRFPAASLYRSRLRAPASPRSERGDSGLNASRGNGHDDAEAHMIQPSCRRFPIYWDLFCEFSGLALLFPQSPRFNRWKMGDFDHRSSREVDQPQGAFLLARPEVVEQVGMWDERFPLFFSDVDWCRRVWQAGWKIRFEPEVFVWHAQGASVKRFKPRAIWSSHVSFWRYFRKWRRSFADEMLSLIAGPLLLGAAVLRIIWHLLMSLFPVVKSGKP